VADIARNLSGHKRKVQVWIHTPRDIGEARFLILRTQPKRGAFWQPVTGGVEPDESFIDGAAREAWEETGFRGRLRPLGYEFEFDGRWGHAHEQCFALAVAADAAGQPPTPKLDPKEHDAAEWVTADEALARVKFETNREALRRLLKALA
jgi:8-oxo-dGTP pyrophosphatase MutT (NUDIX family)